MSTPHLLARYRCRLIAFALLAIALGLAPFVVGSKTARMPPVVLAR